MEFLINMDQPFSYNVTMTSELKNLLNDLSDKRNIDIKEIPLQGGLVVNRDSKTGLNYLSIKGNEAQGVSVIITSDKDIETLNKLADEFQKYPVSSQRSTAGLYALLEISGNRMIVIPAKHGKLICRVPVMLLPENVWRQKMIVQT